MRPRSTRCALALVAALLVTLAAGPVLAACDAQLQASCCCGSAPGQPSPCRDGGPSASTVCCSPAAPAPTPTVAISPDRLKTADDVVLPPAVERLAVPARPVATRAVLDRRAPVAPPPELFSLHESFLI